METEAGLTGRVALVTGTSGGIGGALARRLVEEGAAGVLGYGTHVRSAEELAGEIVANGGRTVAIDADLGTPAGPAKLIESTEAALGTVDVLIANAGLGTKPAARRGLDRSARQIRVKAIVSSAFTKASDLQSLVANRSTPG